MTVILGLCGSAVIAWLIFTYRWMDGINNTLKTLMENHLSHLTGGVERIADTLSAMGTNLATLSTSEQNHHEEVMRQLSKD